MDSRICSAIRNRQVLTFSYDGYHRVVEPHAHGLSKTDKEMVRAYQTAGDSSSGELGWKPFLVEKIVNLRTAGHAFSGTRPKYSRGDRGMNSVHCEL